MKRTIGGLLAVLALVLGAVPIAGASPDNFRFSSYEVDYYLSSDNEGRSTLRTVEKLVAEFPNFDQNHGIERAIPKSYDGHTTSLRIVSVTDGAGKKLNYTTYMKNDYEILRIGDADRYVQGQNTYVITYMQRDVTRYFADTKSDEFYWDTNGTQWQQSFDKAAIRIHLSDRVRSTFNKNVACYQGMEGSTKKCEIITDGTTISATAGNLGPYENVTVAVGFTPGTFRAYEPSLWDRFLTGWLASLVVTSGIGLFYSIWLPIHYMKKSNRSDELDPIAPEYIPPKGVSVLASYHIGKDTRAETTAQIIDLAVRHYITITQTKEKSLWKPAEYELEIVKPVLDLTKDERDFIYTLFGGLSVGDKLQTSTLKNNYAVHNNLQQNGTALIKRIKDEYALRHKDETVSTGFKRFGLPLVILGILTISPLLFIAGVVAYICAWVIRPLTDRGLELRRYLAGLNMYIEAAEKDRIKMLQSPEGAEKTGIKIKGGNDKRVVKLYERVLPYAVLFGHEKEWHEQLAIRYQETGVQPSWYAGHGVFNAAAFSGAMNDFSSSMNSYGASTSSSSGGSSGGGSSGGGGGGGGGGGW